MTYTGFLKNVLNLLHYDQPYKSLPITLLVTAVFAVVISHSLMAALIEKDVDLSLESLKDLVTLLLVYFMLMEHSFNTERSLRLVKLIEDDFLITREECHGGKEMWQRISKHQNNKKKHLQTVFKYLATSLFVLFLGWYLKCFINTFLGIREYKEDRWPTPYLYLVPEFQSHSPSFLAYTYSFHFLVLATGITTGYMIFAVATLSTEKVLADLETFYVLLEFLIEEFPDSACSERAGNKKLEHESFKEEKEAKLRKDMERIVRCHQNINRNFKICADDSALSITVSVAIIANDSCAYAFFILKSNDVKESAIFIFMFIIENLCLFFIYYNGQRIQNQNDILHKYLADLPWIDKPFWFKQTVHIMMTRANVDYEIRPYGIFVLNFVSFKDILKLMFSVGNVLYTMKLTSQSHSQ